MGNNFTNILIGILAVVMLVFAFIYSGGGSSAVSSGLSAETVTVGPPIGAFLRQISAIKTISLNKEVFQNNVLSGLVEKSKEIGTGETGRANPFAPIGTQSAQVSSPAVVETPPAIIETPVEALND